MSVIKHLKETTTTLFNSSRGLRLKKNNLPTYPVTAELLNDKSVTADNNRHVTVSFSRPPLNQPLKTGVGDAALKNRCRLMSPWQALSGRKLVAHAKSSHMLNGNLFCQCSRN